MVDPSVDACVPIVLKARRRSIFGRLSGWLFSQRHFHLKLLSGTTVGVAVIIFLVGVFLLGTLRDHYPGSPPPPPTERIPPRRSIQNANAGFASSSPGYSPV